jgi:tripartite-type tricarboxylate transporter receptor subunit TctC
MTSLIGRLVLAAVTLLVASAAGADAFPDRPIHLIVPNPPGGGFDFVGRIVGQQLAEVIGQQIVVENRTGAGTLVGTTSAARMPADGYALLVGGVSNMAANLGLYKHLDYDPVADFVPLSIPVSYAFALVSRRDLPMSSVKEVVDYARAHPGKLTYASAGIGTGQHITMAIFAHLAGVQLMHIPYRGASAAYQDLIAGRVDLFFDNAGTARPYIESGQVKAFAVSSTARTAGLPQLPTVAETGVANLDSETWFGIFAPAKTPAPIVETLRKALAKAVESPEVVKHLESNGGRMLHMPENEMAPFVKREAERWSNLVREAGVSAD